MKKLFLMLVLMFIFTFTFSNQTFAGSIWGLIKNSGSEQIETNFYTIKVKGVNVRAYVFEVPEMKSICISVWGDGVQQLECKTYKEMGLEEND